MCLLPGIVLARGLMRTGDANSANGTFKTCADVRYAAAFGGKPDRADIAE
jgi:hypothetical protein